MTGKVISIKLVDTLRELKKAQKRGLTEEALNANEYENFEAKMIRLFGEEIPDPNL